ncbi:MAG: fibrobacter succinogenes major paralogous domain-containing protein [Chitinispirillia bacterium]|nr:fibrobacter succinogenes major paralogous domain-containing protein [Chitinispirillia bacterium]
MVDGTDDYGFSARPGGKRMIDGRFNNDARYYGYWWSATEVGSSHASKRSMLYYNDRVDGGGYDKRLGFSVRCVQK